MKKLKGIEKVRFGCLHMWWALIISYRFVWDPSITVGSTSKRVEITQGNWQHICKKIKGEDGIGPFSSWCTPMAVLCKDVRSADQFNNKFINVYKYEVLEGLYTLMAKNKLTKEYPEKPFFSKLLQKYM